jgi:hypothetical protein
LGFRDIWGGLAAADKTNSEQMLSEDSKGMIVNAVKKSRKEA